MSSQISQLTERASPNGDDVFVIADASETNNFKVQAKDVIKSLAAVKTTNESVSSSTTLQNDDDLAVQVVSGVVYSVAINGFVSGLTSGGVKMGFSLPGTGTLDWGFQVVGKSGADHGGSFDESAGTSAGTLFTSDDEGSLRITGAFSPDTSGTFTFQWAQNSSNATATTILDGTNMVLSAE